jgi:hypothetical protein
MREMIKIWLDDEVEPPTEGWVRTFTYAETIELLLPGNVQCLNLDHDLGDEKTAGTGYDVLLWLEKKVKRERFVPPPEIVVHSRNWAARPRMEQAIDQIKRYAKRNLENGSD